MSIAVGIAATLKIAPFILSQEIIGLHQLNQGSLRLEDNEPQGSSFILSLPLSEKKAEEAADIVEAHSQCQ